MKVSFSGVIKGWTGSQDRPMAYSFWSPATVAEDIKRGKVPDGYWTVELRIDLVNVTAVPKDVYEALELASRDGKHITIEVTDERQVDDRMDPRR